MLLFCVSHLPPGANVSLLQPGQLNLVLSVDIIVPGFQLSVFKLQFNFFLKH